MECTTVKAKTMSSEEIKDPPSTCKPPRTKASSTNAQKIRDLTNVQQAFMLFDIQLRRERAIVAEKLREKDDLIHSQRDEIKHLKSTLTHLKSHCQCARQGQTNGYSNESLKRNLNYEKKDDSLKNIDENPILTSKLLAELEKTDVEEYSPSASDSSVGSNLRSAGDIRGSYEPNGQFIYNFSSTKSESVFSEDHEPETNTRDWYASVSDPEDEQTYDKYKNNPVLECMNQILLQSIHTPCKSPDLDNMDRVDADRRPDGECPSESHYYETPISKTTNVYETPGSNIYEKIYSDVGYVKMEYNYQNEIDEKTKVFTPPALPPKPVNLLKKAVLQAPREPDYCSLSELNISEQAGEELKTTTKKPTVKVEKRKEEKRTVNVTHEVKAKPRKVRLETIDSLIVKDMKNKFTNIDRINVSDFQNILDTSLESVRDIPKLPQVSEILIPQSPKSPKSPKVKYDGKKVKFSAIPTQLTIISENDNQCVKAETQTIDVETSHFDFDLNQNFEEFKLDSDCEELAEEYTISNNLTDYLDGTKVEQADEPKECSQHVPLTQYETFLESTGLSTKSLVPIEMTNEESPHFKRSNSTKERVKYYSGHIL